MLEDAIECIDEKSIEIYEEVSWSGSGIWEHGENRRWVVVNNHILPNLVSTAGESSLVGGLGMGPYVQNFEQETETEDEDFRIVTSGSTMMRLCTHNKQITGSDTITDEELAPATTRDSGVIPESTPIIANIELMREDDPVPGPSSSHPRTSFRQTSDVAKRSKSYSKSFIEAKKKQRRRKRKQKRNSLSHRRRNNRNVAISVESSPGRKSPSPSTLEKLKLSLDT